MRTRSISTWILPIAVLAIMTVASLAVGGAAVVPADTDSEVVLYYFHGARRCNTCQTIESYAHEALEGKFKDALEAGTLNWTVLNTDESENAHFVKDFSLVSSSLVLVEVADEEVVRHQVLQEAWTLVRDKPRFIEYIQGSVGEFLE